MPESLSDHLLACNAVELRLVSNFRGYLTLIAAYMGRGNQSALSQMKELNEQILDDSHYVNVFYRKFLALCERSGNNSQNVQNITAELQALREDEFESSILSRYILKARGAAFDDQTDCHDAFLRLLEVRPGSDAISTELEQEYEKNKVLELQLREPQASGQVGQRLAAANHEHEVLRENYQNALALIQDLNTQIADLKTQIELPSAAASGIHSLLLNPRLIGGDEKIQEAINKLVVCEKEISGSPALEDGHNGELEVDQLLNVANRLTVLCEEKEERDFAEKEELYKTIREGEAESSALRHEIASINDEMRRKNAEPESNSTEIIDLRSRVSQLEDKLEVQKSLISDVLTKEKQINASIELIESLV